MKTSFYHESFDFAPEFQALGEKGLIVNTKRAVCPSCDGYGTHFRRDLDENSMIDTYNDECDEEGYQAYRRGAFDEVCTQCNGGKVIDEPTDLPEWAINRISDHYKDIEDDKRTRWAENGYRD